MQVQVRAASMTEEEDSGPSGAAVPSASASASNATAESGGGKGKAEPTGADSLSSQRVFKKSSPNSKLTLYLSSRDLVVSTGKIDRLQGVLLVDPEFVEDRKVYGQITLTFRYGREDEEVMGLKFCNEAVMCLAQLYPPPSNVPEDVTPLQEALIKRLGSNAYPFNMEITPLAPPSVQLVPAKEYSGAPIGTSYDVRAYVADRADEKFHRKTTVRMGIRVVQRVFAPPSPYGYDPMASTTSGSGKTTLFGCKSAPLETTRFFAQQQQPQMSKSAEVGINNDLKNTTTTTTIEANDSKSNKVTFQEDKGGGGGEERIDDDDADINPIEQVRACCEKRHSVAAFLAELPAPRALVEKQFLLSDGCIELEASLDKAVYHHGEEIQVMVHVRNSSNKTVRRIKVFIVQHVDVCMFSNGKFKNVVSMINSKDDCPLSSGRLLSKTYTLLPVKSSTKNWIALEDSYTKSGSSLASSVTASTDSPDERNVFAIYVSYYVKVKLICTVMGGEVSLKLPFTLMHTCNDFDPAATLTRIVEPTCSRSATVPEVKQEKDGT
ncbi:PREDICTED: arrestin homolog isoform X2 [Nicrophorus vespilloides]|uniref:Arrestin homolog isoform X2 n=1 Tax=Nicrophorus vespilloides TaxID=110193 RepID=A0ABM1M9G5_NICVS|nr:PREDICTED: arrestin homolog isoform X2 [Nicrophorus vespilloides]